MSNITNRRLTRELQQIQKDPPNGIVAVPNGDNILEWHYLITGAPNTPYSGGSYWGKLVFPKEYPLRPPSVMMLTPNGRFMTGRRLCLSMSDYHPETWNPLWSVSTILTGVYSFMNESTPTLGSIEASTNKRRKLASQSLRWNCNQPQFINLFPDIVDSFRADCRARGESHLLSPSSSSSLSSVSIGQQPQMQMQFVAAAFIAVVSILLCCWGFF